MDRQPPSEAELREQYQRTGLHRIGISFEHAMAMPAVRIALNGAIQGLRRRAARQAREAAINYQIKEAA